ncbi:hypothetical protein BpHYR1_032489 [Brachionus plicatilis]|uniref:Uncharacterized protein n=1 Tax=Brachionus plicatilis TaxID=10195 RepID=A0A3M7QLX1_BRAPC|nr:hypothetical protein BpHYR1_032489 [Brachionus plicatilis]
MSAKTLQKLCSELAKLIRKLFNRVHYAENCRKKSINSINNTPTSWLFYTGAFLVFEFAVKLMKNHEKFATFGHTND